MSENVIQAKNKSPNHIFKDNEFHVCLVCKENIKGESNLDHNILVSNHINSKKHNKNVRGLFKLCIPGWSGCNAEIVKDLVFDVNFKRNESSFVSKTDNNFSCLLCKESISEETDPNKILTSLMNHIQSDIHLTNLKNGVFWVHPLDDNLSFLMFHKSEVYCSICKQNVPNAITCPLKKAVDHLKVQHSTVYKILVEQKKKDSFTDEKSVCESLKCLTLTDDNKPSNANTCSPCADLDSELSLDTSEYEAEDFVSYDDNSDKSEESSNESIDICVDDFLCPECGELIEIYNENFDFSMDLHLQKHKPLMDIYTEDEFDYQENVDYVCPICQETINIFNKNLELSIDRHFEDKRHEHERFTLADCGDKNRLDFLSRVFDSLSDKIRGQQSVFVMDGNEVFCKLCNCTVSSSKNVPDACKAFVNHMSSAFHLHQFNASSQFLSMAVINYNKQSFPQEGTKEQDITFKFLCEQNPIIESNKLFIEKRQMNYYCTVCDKHICYSPKQSTQTLNFVLHFNSKPHMMSLELMKKNKITVISKLSKKLPVVRLNQTFIIEKDGDFLCELCQLQIKFSQAGTALEKHCASPLHNTELSTRGFRYVSKLKYEKLTKKYKSVLNKTLKYSHFIPHAHFIHHNGEDFCCIICNVSISGSKNTGKNVQKHFFSLKHREKCFEVTCSNQDYKRPDLKNEDKTMLFVSSTNTNKEFVNTNKEIATSVSANTNKEFVNTNKEKATSVSANTNKEFVNTNKEISTSVSANTNKEFVNTNKEIATSVSANTNKEFVNTNKEIATSVSANTNKEFVNTNKKIATSQKRAKKILKTLALHSYAIRKYIFFIGARNGHFFCKICEETITCTHSGNHLKKHFQLKKH